LIIPPDDLIKEVCPSLLYLLLESCKQTTDGERVNWGKIKIIKIHKKEEHTVMFKYSYDDDNYKKINVEKKSKRGERRSGKEVVVCLKLP
jgi:hypothetical protein